jgi:hypothetical protein
MDGGTVGIGYISDGWEPYVSAIQETDRDPEPWVANPNGKILKPTHRIALT